jgi:predicted transcriptional regulator
LPDQAPVVKVVGARKQLLKVIADATNAGVPLTVKKIFDFAGMDQLNFNHALHELENNNFVRTYVSYQKGKMVQLTPLGTKYVLDESLAHKNEVKGFGGSS